jgi:hypothetical protein
MTTSDLESVAQTLVAEGKGILAADETIPKNYAMTDTPSAMGDRCHRSGGNDGKCSN